MINEIEKLIDEVLKETPKLNNLLNERLNRNGKRQIISEYYSSQEKEPLNEMEYEGNLGAIEMMKFAKIATPEENKKMDFLLDNDRYADAWKLLQQVTHDRLKDIKFKDDMSKGTISEMSSMAGGAVEGFAGSISDEKEEKEIKND
jgi:hypothetical protein